MTRLLSGKVAVITGAGRGLGRAIALKFASEEGKVVLVSRTQRELDDVALECNRLSRAITVRADVSRENDVLTIRRAALRRFGRVDILVNNAGINSPIGPVARVAPVDWMKTIKVNLWGTFLCTRAFLPGMMKQRKGKIINIAGSGERPLVNFSAYAASKSAVIRFSEIVAAEVEPFRIDVNSVAPGGIATRMTDEISAAGAKAGSAEASRVRKIKATGGVPLEVPIALVLFLASSMSDRLTGKLLSAVHDDWRDLKGKTSEVSHSDLYTMRRIDGSIISRLTLPRRVREA